MFAPGIVPQYDEESGREVTHPAKTIEGKEDTLVEVGHAFQVLFKFQTADVGSKHDGVMS